MCRSKSHPCAFPALQERGRTGGGPLNNRTSCEKACGKNPEIGEGEGHKVSKGDNAAMFRGSLCRAHRARSRQVDEGQGGFCRNSNFLRKGEVRP